MADDRGTDPCSAVLRLHVKTLELGRPSPFQLPGPHGLAADPRDEVVGAFLVLCRESQVRVGRTERVLGDDPREILRVAPSDRHTLLRGWHTRRLLDLSGDADGLGEVGGAAPHRPVAGREVDEGDVFEEGDLREHRVTGTRPLLT